MELTTENAKGEEMNPENMHAKTQRRKTASKVAASLHRCLDAASCFVPASASSYTRCPQTACFAVMLFQRLRTHAVFKVLDVSEHFALPCTSFVQSTVKLTNLPGAWHIGTPKKSRFVAINCLAISFNPGIYPALHLFFEFGVGHFCEVKIQPLEAANEFPNGHRNLHRNIAARVSSKDTLPHIEIYKLFALVSPAIVVEMEIVAVGDAGFCGHGARIAETGLDGKWTCEGGNR